MNLMYILPRIVRHFMPEGAARFLLRRGWFIRPGLETADPRAATDRYIDAIREQGRSLSGKRVLVFGYGGSYAVGVWLLKHGAAHVLLCDNFASPDQKRNLELARPFGKYLLTSDDGVTPRPEFMTLMHGDIRTVATAPVDYVLSTSVYEHLQDVAGFTGALAKLTGPTGLNVHYVDLRDHFFRYPFEMLRFSERQWESFLNPSSNLNRFRVRDYQEVFEKNFREVRLRVLARDEARFRADRHRIRPEFLTGDESVDSVTLLEIVAREPRG